MRALAISCVVFTAALHGQMPTFEVATVKRAITQNGAALPMMKCRGGAGTPDPTRLTCVNAPLSFLLCEAYGKEFYEVIGPDWMPLMAQGYDVAAIIPQGISKEQYLTMYQNLLVERFGLVFHHETRDWPGYTLGVSKNGAKLRRSAGSLPPNESFLRPVFSPGHVQVTAHGRSLDVLANNSPASTRPSRTKPALRANTISPSTSNPIPPASTEGMHPRATVLTIGLTSASLSRHNSASP